VGDPRPHVEILAALDLKDGRPSSDDSYVLQTNSADYLGSESMRHRVRLAMFVTALAMAGPALATPADAIDSRAREHLVAEADGPGDLARAARTVSLKGPGDVTEGSRYVVTANVSTPRRARTIRWQALQPEYPYSSTLVWTTIQTRKTHGLATSTYRALADESQSQRFRVIVTYDDHKTIRSKPITIRLWHWTDLSHYRAYYEVGGVIDSEYYSFAMDGDTWKGWYDWDDAMAESRYTLGRNCKGFRGTLGLGDSSDDGATGRITLLTDESKTVYTSPTLVPGKVVKLQLPLSSPYRFSIQGRDTTPVDGVDRDVYRAVGAPQFLCHFR
jgi:hypothetical protein